MSDKINWLALGSWSVVATFQFSATVRDLWLACKKRQRKSTEYERVVNGEAFRGWRKLPDIRKPMRPFLGRYYLLNERLADTDDPCYSGDPSVSHVDLCRTHPLPNGRKLFRIHRISLIRLVEHTLYKVIYDPGEWENTAICSYITDRVRCSVFRRRGSETIFVLLSNTVRRTTRTFKAVLPVMPASSFGLLAYFVEEPKPRLHLIFVGFRGVADGVECEFFDVKYDCSGSNPQYPLQPLSWESLTVPVGNRFGGNYYFSGRAETWVAFDRNNHHNNDAHLCVSFDHTKSWRVETLTQWMASMRQSKLGSSILEAMQSFEALSPPESWDYLKLSSVRCLDYVQPFGNLILGTTNGDGLLLRWQSPPTLKRLAVDAVFRAKPSLKMDELKEAVGVEIDDGVTGEGDDEAYVINL